MYNELIPLRDYIFIKLHVPVCICIYKSTTVFYVEVVRATIIGGQLLLEDLLFFQLSYPPVDVEKVEKKTNLLIIILFITLMMVRILLT